jgi:hypothetical protein
VAAPRKGLDHRELDGPGASSSAVVYLHVELCGRVQSISNLRVDAVFEVVERAGRFGDVGRLGLSLHAGGRLSITNAPIDDARIKAFFIEFDFVSYRDKEAILHSIPECRMGTRVVRTEACDRLKEFEKLEAGTVPTEVNRWCDSRIISHLWR